MIINYLRSILLLCLIFFSAASQTINSTSTIVDSLNIELLKAPADSVKFDILTRLAIELQKKRPYEALSYGKKALPFAKTPSEKVGVLIMNGITYTMLADHSSALSSYFQSLKLLETLNEEGAKATVFHNIAACYIALKRYNLAEKYLNEALIIKKQGSNNKDIGTTYNNLGILSVYQGHLYKAIGFYNKAIEANQKSGESACLMLNNLGDVYIRLKDYSKAEYYCKKALLAYTNNAELIAFHISLGELYIEQKRFDEAAKHLFAAQMITDSSGVSNIDVQYTIAIMYEQQKDFKNANLYYKKYYALKDSSLNETVTKQIGELQTKYEFDKKDQELLLSNKDRVLLQTEIKNKEKTLFLLFVIILLAFLLIAIVFFFFQQKRKTADILKRKNQKIEGLMTEMYHRVKNNFQVLSDIFAIQSAGDYQAGNKHGLQDSKARIDALLLLHQKLNPNNPLEEINFIKYIDELIENIAFQFDAPATIIIKDFDLLERHVDIDLLLPVGLIVNEILTNAFKHAVPKVKNPEIHISVHEADGAMKIIIKDNGPAQKDSIKEHNHSFGLRLLQTFAKQIQADLSHTVANGLEWQLIFKTHAN